MYNFFWFFLTTAREEGVPRGRSEINSVKRRAFRYTWSNGACRRLRFSWGGVDLVWVDSCHDAVLSRHHHHGTPSRGEIKGEKGKGKK